MAACLAEHGELGPAVGAIYDGAGLGSDGTQWGGELLVGDIASVRRAGHLRPTGLPGGDRAAAEPWRMACSWLAQAGTGEEPPSALSGMVERERWAALARIVGAGIASPPTTSVGRLFDAVAAICGLRARSREEGLAAMELEAASDGSERSAYELHIRDAELLEIDPRETVAAVSADIAAGRPVALVGARFHNALAAGTVRALRQLAEREGTPTVVLSGGVFQNRLLLERCREGLEAAGLRVLFPRRLPPGDGGICFGQAAIAAVLGA
jgi:hydrogenase maturation protein HypF